MDDQNLGSDFEIDSIEEDLAADNTDSTVNSPPKTPVPNPLLHLSDIPHNYILRFLLRAGWNLVGDEETAHVFVMANSMGGGFRPCIAEVVSRYAASQDHANQDPASEDWDVDTPEPDSSTDNQCNSDDEYISASIPIHVEYAVFRLPFLGRILLSGKVFCGDTVKISLPHPEVWAAVVSWMYTGMVVRLPDLEDEELAEMVCDCIEFLGGHV